MMIRTQRAVHEVIDVMKSNLSKVLDRDDKLAELDVKAGE